MKIAVPNLRFTRVSVLQDTSTNPCDSIVDAVYSVYSQLRSNFVHKLLSSSTTGPGFAFAFPFKYMSSEQVFQNILRHLDLSVARADLSRLRFPLSHLAITDFSDPLNRVYISKTNR